MIHTTPLFYQIYGNELVRKVANINTIVYKICICGKMMIRNNKTINASHDIYEDQCNYGILSTLDYNNSKKYNRLRSYDGDLSP